MGATDVKLFQRGETIEVYAEVKSQAGTFVDPDAIDVTITDGSNVVRATNAAMTLSATGTYVYYYNLATTSTTGKWTARVRTLDGTGANAKWTIDDCECTVEA